MKIKNIMGLTASFVLSLCFSTAVLAADGDNYVVGTPIDISTGEEVTNYTVGQKLLVPVDFDTQNNTVTDFTVRMNYDTTVLDYGIDFASLSDEEFDLISSYGLDTYKLTDLDLATICAVDPIGTWRGTRFTPTGDLTTNEVVDGEVVNTWNAAIAASTENGAETYFCFTVVKEISNDDLNYDLFTPDVSWNGSTVNSDLEIDATANKANACFGAFNINIDSSALPYWIQALYVKVGGGEAVPVTEYVTTDNVNYTFPVRITSNSGSAASTTVEVLADVSSSESDSTNTTQESMGTFEVQLDSPTSYVDQTVSAQ